MDKKDFKNLIFFAYPNQKFPKEYITFYDIASLLKGDIISESLINAILEHEKIKPNFKILPMQTTQFLCNKNKNNSQIWKDLQTYTEHFFKKNSSLKIIFPTKINKGKNGHFKIYVVELISINSGTYSFKLESFDSLYSRKKLYEETEIEKCLYSVFCSMYKICNSETKFNCIDILVPQQKNDKDCGLFMMENINSIIDEIDFSQNVDRRKYFKKLVNIGNYYQFHYYKKILN